MSSPYKAVRAKIKEQSGSEKSLKRLDIFVSGELLEDFDKAAVSLGYPNRSEATRQAMRLLIESNVLSKAKTLEER